MHCAILPRLFALSTCLAMPFAQAAVCRVAPDGSGSGASWSAPMALQTALADESCSEVWLREGLYKPIVPANPTNPTAEERKVGFAIQADTRLYGGFAGTESLRDQRDPQAHRSVLSGDIDGNDTTDADGIVTDPDGVRYGNSYHVVTLDGGTARGPVLRGTVLDGVTITAGRANGPDADRLNRGGGLLCRATNSGQECSPTLRNVTFSGNVASNMGGGMCVLATNGGIGRPLLDRVRFSRNAAGDGAALYNDGRSAGNASPELVDVEFTGNEAGSEGGAIYNNGAQGTSNPLLDRVGFSGNSATWGGALYNDGSGAGIARARIANATFNGNNASSHGGAIYNYASNSGDTRMTLVHATFGNNTASRGGAIHDSGTSDNAGATVLGSILWGDNASGGGAEVHGGSAALAIRDSIVAGGCPDGVQCSNILTADPALGALADNGGFSRTMLPGTGSPALDAVNAAWCPLTDQRRVPRAQGTNCDMGAVEVQAPPCHVKHDATGANNGTSWANAYTDLQDALASPGCGEIRVARGVYVPTAGTDRDISFGIRPGQRVYGGFAGTETDLDQRDPAANRTVLSGDIDRDDEADADGVLIDVADRRGANSKRIVLMDGTTAAGGIHANTVLDGFAITGAYSVLESPSAGLYCDGRGDGNDCSPTLRNLLFSANTGDEGGGMRNDADGNGRASPTLENVTFRNNVASNFGGAGLYNRAWNGGDSSPTLTNVTFVGNWGIAMVNDGSYGGDSSPVLNHVTFHANSDRFTAAAMYSSGGANGRSEPILTNVILWGGTLTLPDEAECAGNGVEMCNWNATPTIRASLIAGGCPAGAICGPDVRDLDPLLAPLADNGGVGPTLMPAMDSPAIDAGADDVCAATDQRGVTRPQGLRCDIGALEAVDDRIFASGFETR